MILSGFLLVLQAAVLDCFSFDSFAFEQDALTLSKVNVGGREILQALVVALVVVVIDEPADADFESAR